MSYVHPCPVLSWLRSCVLDPRGRHGSSVSSRDSRGGVSKTVGKAVLGSRRFLPCNKTCKLNCKCQTAHPDIAVEREHKEWRDHRTNLSIMWHPRASLTYPRFRTGACAHLARLFFSPSDHSEMCWVCEDVPPKCQRHDDKTIHDFLLCGTCEFLDDGQSDEERLAELAGPPTLGRSAAWD